MRLKSILLTVFLTTLSITTVCLTGCSDPSSTSTALSEETVAQLPFTVPEEFSYNADATQQNQMLTFTSENKTTLIVSYTDSSAQLLSESKKESITEASLIASYKESGLDVSISDLKKQDKDTELCYTYTVSMASHNATTITYKYIRITDEKVLDISCGGNEKNLDALKADYAALEQVLKE